MLVCRPNNGHGAGLSLSILSMGFWSFVSFLASRSCAVRVFYVFIQVSPYFMYVCIYVLRFTPQRSGGAPARRPLASTVTVPAVERCPEQYLTSG